MRKRVIGGLGILLFAVGVLLGLALAVGATWADTEAAFYGFHSYADRSLTGVACPVLVTGTEQGQVVGTFRNPSDRPLQLQVLAELSTRFLPERTAPCCPCSQVRRGSSPGP